MKKLAALFLVLALLLGACAGMAEETDSYAADLTGKKIGISRLNLKNWCAAAIV